MPVAKMQLPVKGKKEIRQLKERIRQFSIMYEKIIESMENNKNPMYRMHLQMFRNRLSPEVFERNFIKIHALCILGQSHNCLWADKNVAKDDSNQSGTVTTPNGNSAPEDNANDQEPMN